MNKSIIGAVIVVLVSTGAILVAFQSGSNDAAEEVTEASTSQANLYSAEDVAAHATETDCWAIIDGSVYDITEYIPRHPGGDDILRACGVDATTQFSQRMTPDGEKIGSGLPHSSNAAGLLEQYKLGELSN